jgi:GxxExxY protein
MAELILREECYAIVGACFEVYNTLGSGFLEAVYQEALELEFSRRSIPCRSQAELKIAYKGQILKKTYIADLVAYDRIIVELKAVSRLTGQEDSQVLNYLRATGLRLGLLANFGGPVGLEWKRLVL